MNGVIFDMDGVLSDTERLHGQTESEQLKRYGISVTPEELVEKYTGWSTRNIYPDIFANHEKDLPRDIEEMMNEKYEILFEIAKRGEITPIPGAQNLVQSFFENNWKIAVASGSRSDLIELVIQALKIEEYITAIASSHEVKKGKPEPDVFLLAAKRISIAPDHCIVIEDAKTGVTAAIAAGMHCIGYQGTSLSTQDLSGADNIVDSLTKIDPSQLAFAD